MGMFDYFYPDPPIGCHQPKCTGHIRDWQGKYSGNCLFQWRQGKIAPVDQAASEDCKLDRAKLDAIRLPTNTTIVAGWGSCDCCGSYAQFLIECTTDGEARWKNTRILAKTAAASHPEEGIIQCRGCSNIWPQVEGKQLYICPTCKSVVLVSAPAGSRKLR